jgi:hypothetical protein
MRYYGWVITRDWITEGQDVDVVGPRDIPEDLLVRLRNGEGDRFQMYDDDGELYYEGRIVWAAEDYAPGLGHVEEGFEPLYDFGMPNAGCVDIRYYELEKGWVRL